MEQEPLLSASGLAVGYTRGKGTGKVVRQGLDFVLCPGEMVCLLGANGTGKSTLLRTLAAFQPPLAGQLLLQGKPLAAYSEREKSRRIGVVLTDKAQAGGLLVRELVALGRQPHTGFWGRLGSRDRRLVDEALASVRIAHKAEAYVAELSDGERQKVMIAKALVQECPLILLDEPTAFLDVESRIEIMLLLHGIARREGRAVLLSTHDIDQALVQADRLWLLGEGGGVQCGVTEDMVYAGALDALFDPQRMRFDRASGTYFPRLRAARRIALRAEDADLRHWCLNLLARCGWEAVPFPAAPGMPSLEARSPSRFLLTLPGSAPRPCSSFAELAAALR